MKTVYASASSQLRNNLTTNITSHFSPFSFIWENDMPRYPWKNSKDIQAGQPFFPIQLYMGK
jgi:hypothetical protein